jgi:hypothetical protein
MVNLYQRFGTMYRLHIQEVHFDPEKIGAIRCPETSVKVFFILRYVIPQKSADLRSSSVVTAAVIWHSFRWWALNILKSLFLRYWTMLSQCRMFIYKMLVWWRSWGHLGGSALVYWIFHSGIGLKTLWKVGGAVESNTSSPPPPAAVTATYWRAGCTVTFNRLVRWFNHCSNFSWNQNTLYIFLFVSVPLVD